MQVECIVLLTAVKYLIPSWQGCKKLGIVEAYKQKMPLQYRQLLGREQGSIHTNEKYRRRKMLTQTHFSVLKYCRFQ